MTRATKAIDSDCTRAACLESVPDACVEYSKNSLVIACQGAGRDMSVAWLVRSVGIVRHRCSSTRCVEKASAVGKASRTLSIASTIRSRMASVSVRVAVNGKVDTAP